jgi:pimeloyl-ACP methyl ester carboxylesterase
MLQNEGVDGSLPPAMPAEPLARIGLVARITAFSTLVALPEWPRLRRAQAAATPLAGPEEFHAIVPGYREIAGRTVRIAEAGDPTRPTVVFLSPFPLTILTFEAVWHQLGDELHLIAYDVPGLGKSPGGPEVMRYDVAARHLLDLLEELDLSDVHLVGHDIPSAIVLCAAATDRSRIASLVIGDGPGIDISTAPRRLNGSIVQRLLSWGAPYRAFVGRIGGLAVLWVIKRLAFVRAQLSDVELADQIEAHRGGRIRVMMNWFAGAVDGVRSHVDPVLDDLQVPVQVIWGAEDVVVLEEMGRELDRRLPRSQFTSIPSAGHAPWADQPEEYADLVRSWVRDGHLRAGSTA